MPAPAYLVTGAASGIGAELARCLLLSGARVLGLDHHAPPLAGVEPLVCDLRDPEAVQRAVVALRSGLLAKGSLMGIAHVAGLPGTRPAEEVVAVNFLAPRALTLGLREVLAHGASVVVVSSLAALRCRWSQEQLQAVCDTAAWSGARDKILAVAADGGSAYEASKRLLTHWLPDAVAGFQASAVRFNAVSPGPVDTPMLADFRTSMGTDRIDAAARTVGRHATAAEVAAALHFLIGPTSTWVNGTDLRVDGGLAALRESAARFAPT